VKDAEKIAADHLGKSASLRGAKGRPFYAIGGTWRSLARLHMHQIGYPLRVMHHYAIDADSALDFCKLVARRRDRRPIGPCREPPAAAATARRSSARPSAMRPSRCFRRWRARGTLRSLSPQAKQEDLLLACQELAHCARARAAPRGRLGQWSERLRRPRPDETKAEARLRQAACLLSR
jgi:exopolyphosphatase/guanosine-5'-triphosphate,3'-diphosphate pyrophosphatase